MKISERKKYIQTHIRNTETIRPRVLDVGVWVSEDVQISSAQEPRRYGGQ